MAAEGADVGQRGEVERVEDCVGLVEGLVDGCGGPVVGA